MTFQRQKEMKLLPSQLTFCSPAEIQVQEGVQDPEIYIKRSDLSLRTTNQKNHVNLSFFRQFFVMLARNLFPFLVSD